MTNTLFSIDVEDVTKHYGQTLALDHFSLRVAPGRTVALIGPNGAGKSTFVEILMGLRRPDSGRVHVLGYDVLADARGHVDRLGVQLQETRLFSKVSLREYLALFQGLYSRCRDACELAARMHLTELIDVPLARLSGGQRQRAALALALVNDPDLIILDEPTVGLDPIARRDFWDLIREFQKEKTLLFSTHYMEEAQALANEIVMISHGRVVANGTADEIISRTSTSGATTLEEAYGVVVTQALEGIAA